MLNADRKHNTNHWCAATQTWETDWGFGISKCYHREIVTDPRFTDYKWQLQEVWEMYKGGTRFYGYDVRYKAKKSFIFK